MRADVPLYIIAIICFGLAAGLHFYSSEPAQAYTVVLAILGAIFAGVGYSMRPKQPETIEAVKETVIEEAGAAEVEAKPSLLKLTDVRGIGPKRAEQLKKVGIQSVEDLAKESSEELSKKAKVSAKVADKWIEAAKKALEEKKQ